MNTLDGIFARDRAKVAQPGGLWRGAADSIEWYAFRLRIT